MPTDIVKQRKAEITEKLNQAYKDFKTGKKIPNADTFGEIIAMKAEDCKTLTDIEALKNDHIEYSNRAMTHSGSAYKTLRAKENTIRTEILNDFTNRINNCKTPEELKTIKQEYSDFQKSDDFYENQNLAAYSAQRRGETDYRNNMLDKYNEVKTLIETKSKEFKADAPDTKTLGQNKTEEYYDLENFDLEFSKILEPTPTTKDIPSLKKDLDDVLKSENCAMPDYMSRIPKDASEAETTKLLQQMFEESKFFSRVSTCEKLYGKNFEFGKMMKELSDESAKNITEGKSFNQVLGHIASGYSKETTINTNNVHRIGKSGIYRGDATTPPPRNN